MPLQVLFFMMAGWRSSAILLFLALKPGRSSLAVHSTTYVASPKLATLFASRGSALGHRSMVPQIKFS